VYRVISAEYPPLPCEGVLVERSSRFVLTQVRKVEGKAVGGAQRVGVICTEYPLSPCEGVLVERSSRFVLTQVRKVEGKVIGGAQRVGVICTEYPLSPCEVSSLSVRAAWYSPMALNVAP